MAKKLHLLLPQANEALWSFPLYGAAPSSKGRKLPNGTVLVKDENAPDVIWKLTPWEKAERLIDELAIYNQMLSGEFSENWVRLLGVNGTSEHFARAYDYAAFGEVPHFLRMMTQPLTQESMRHILAQIAKAMADLHADRIIHRDLKAENILVFEEGHLPRVKLADFDRAIVLDHGKMLDKPVGSLFHMAPELLAWKNYDRRVDVYAFGIVIFEVVGGGARLWPQVATGLPNSLTREEFAHKVIDEGLQPQWQFEDEALHILAQRCLAPNPEDRPEFLEICAFFDNTSSTLTVKQSENITSSLSSSLSMAATIGCQRQSMEDALCVLDLGATKIMGLFDGFKTSRVSAFAAQSLALIVADCLQKEENRQMALEQSFATLQSKINRLDATQDHDCLHISLSGSTAIVAILDQDQLVLSSIGDSSALLIGQEGVRRLNRAHSPTLVEERLRIETTGGIIQREIKMLESGETVPWGPERVFKPGIKTGLAITRALGALPLQPVISNQVETTHFSLSNADEWLLLCSDGVSGLLSDEQIQDFCQRGDDAQTISKQLIAHVKQLGAPDNASIIMVKLFA